MNTDQINKEIVFKDEDSFSTVTKSCMSCKYYFTDGFPMKNPCKDCARCSLWESHIEEVKFQTVPRDEPADVKRTRERIQAATTEALLNLSAEDVGIKYDGDKVPVELIPYDAVYEVGKVLKFGAKKYDSWNWYKGMKTTRLLAAALRHIWKYMRGYDLDAESGLPHLAHALCCLMFSMQFYLEGREDDRPKWNTLKKGGITNED